MSQAEIKTKLSADGSELQRAFQKGLAQGTDFKARMAGIGKSFGAAFSVAAVVQGIRSIGQAQLDSIEQFKSLAQEADGFTKKLENLNEKVENAESFKSLNKALLDYKQALRDVNLELDALTEKENAGGAAGILNAVGDAFELLASGKTLTADEARLNMLEKQRERTERAQEQAQVVAAQRAKQLRNEQRAALDEFDVGRTVEQSIESGNLPAMQSFLEAAKETERQLRVTFAGNPDAGILAQIKEAVAMSDKLAKGIEAAGQAAVSSARSLGELVDVGMSEVNEKSLALLEKNREDQASLFRFLMADMQAELDANRPEGQRFSSLRAMGANELGAAGPARSGIGPAQQAMIDLLKKQITETGKIPDAIQSLGNLFGVFI